MRIAALVAWIVTAGGGLSLLAVWFAKGGLQGGRDAPTRLRSHTVLTHAGLAVLGLVLWVVHMTSHDKTLAWIAVADLVVIGALGTAMFIPWLADRGAVMASRPPEQHFPVLVVAAHGVAAVTTVALVVLAAAGVGT